MISRCASRATANAVARVPAGWPLEITWVKSGDHSNSHYRNLMNLNLAPVELTGAFFGGRRLRSALLTFALHTLTGLIIDTFWN